MTNGSINFQGHRLEVKRVTGQTWRISLDGKLFGQLTEQDGELIQAWDGDCVEAWAMATEDEMTEQAVRIIEAAELLISIG